MSLWRRYFCVGVGDGWEASGKMWVGLIHSLNQRKGQSTVVSSQLNPDWDCLQANHMWTASKIDNLICSFVLEPCVTSLSPAYALPTNL
jgi:hypothetical protein